MNTKRTLLLSAAICAAASMANAAAIIDNGTIMLGVDDYGQLNVSNGDPGPENIIGVTDMRTGYEATSPGCLCEGWGVGTANGSGTAIASGSANNAYGVFNLTSVSFTSTASSATSVVEMGTSLRVTHLFAPPPETDDLYRVTVSIENISGADIADLRYRRVMDWDVEPDPFHEYVTIGGTAAATAVLFASDNGFASADPFAGPSSILATGDFTDTGTADHGALFDFGFGGLLAGTTFSFDIFYGAAPTEREALSALAAVEAEVYSLGQASDDANGTTPGRSTFIFGFKGVGGEAVPDPVVPVPASAFLLFGGLGMLGGLRLRGRKAG